MPVSQQWLRTWVIISLPDLFFYAESKSSKTEKTIYSYTILADEPGCHNPLTHLESCGGDGR
jgi:hypothetical protein